MKDRELAVPRASAVDRIRAMMLGAVGTVPIAGSLLSAILGEVWAEPLQRRLDSLFEEFARRICQLEVALSDDDLRRESLVTAAMLAGRDARSSDSAKISYLASALANVAASPTWSHDEAATLFRIMSQLTGSHLRVLSLLKNPDDWSAKNNVTIRAVAGADGAYRQRDMIADALDQLGHDVTGLQTILQDLESQGLLSTIGIAEENPRQAAARLLAMTSELGNRVVEFVTWQPDALRERE